MFITFEGIDLCGKSTQASMLYKYLTDNGKKAVLVREPGGTLISERIRDILLDKRNLAMESLTEFLLFSSSRCQLTKEVILPNLKKNYIVICDRYYDSSTAYQGYGGGVDLKIIEKINKIAASGLKPDVTFFINIGYGESLKRRRLINKKHDRIELKEQRYYKRVYEGYIDIAKSERKRIVEIDGTKKINDIHKIIVTNLKNKFK
ncbi:MAG: dTMP kinase [Ignavibacteria bacterium]|nr:dTMP kinase [Ignavibacteria bacterium]